MHKTCHENVRYDECGKEFGAKRNLLRHNKVKHAGFQKDTRPNSNTSLGESNGNDATDADMPAADNRDDPLNDATFVVVDDVTFVIT